MEGQPSVAAASYDSASKIDVSGKRVGIILTGGNVDLDALPWM
jgi:threonine dehydratase